MVKGMARSRSVGVKQKLKLELSKVQAPVVNLDKGIDWPVTFLINLTELWGGAVLAPMLMAECPFDVPHALQKNLRT